MTDIILRNVRDDRDRMLRCADLFLAEGSRRLGIAGCIIYSYDDAAYIVTRTRTAIVVRRNERSPRQVANDAAKESTRD